MKYRDVKVKKCKNVYPPSEDTFLLVEAVLPHIGVDTSFLEVGVGTGLLSILAAKRGATVTGTDIRSEALDCAKKNAERNEVSLKLIKSDLFTKVSGMYEVIAFNPPYLPAVKDDRVLSPSFRAAVVGGSEGTELALKFVEAVDRYLMRDGSVFLVILSRGSEREQLRRHEVVRRAKELGFRVEAAGKDAFFFERIFVIKLEKEREK